MITQSYYKCSLFDEKIDNLDFFSFFQEELILKKVINNNNIEFENKKVKYSCSYKEKIKFSDKPVAIIPIKNNISLLKFTLQNLLENKIFDIVDFVIVDDRSTENIKGVCDTYPVNYLRVDNDKGFNFSTLNNIAAKIIYDCKIKEIILWNSDLWTTDKQTIEKLIDLHRQNDSTISGTKLLYPPFSWNGEKVSHNINTIFPNHSENYRGTIQFGGSSFVFVPQTQSYFPIHSYRFGDKDNVRVNVNKVCEFVTGAFQIIDLQWFIKNGGLNPSLSKNFQDVDLCLRASEQEKKVMYFGKDLFLYHDESVSLSKDKNDIQFVSDNVLYSKLWDNKRILKTIYGFF